jgi:hypothetical protein
MELNLPPRDPDRPQDDPWDADVVRYLLGQPGVRGVWTRGVLLECLREQPNRLRNDQRRVDQADRLAASYGVVKRREPRGNRTIVRLERTDAGAPDYPSSEDERRFLINASEAALGRMG